MNQEQKHTPTLKEKEIIEILIKKGNSIDRAKEIFKTAVESSNPTYILNYWGVK